MTKDKSTSFQSTDAKKIRVLIVDDYPTIIAGAETILGATDDILVVGSAGNGKVALEKILEVRPDVVLVDLALEGEEDGLDVARTIRDKHPEIYVIIFTRDRNNTKELLELCLAFGVHGYLLKDRPGYDVSSAIRSVYAGKTWIDPTISGNLILSKKSTQEITEALTKRQMEVLFLLSEALSNKEIGEKLSIAKSTVAKHLADIYPKIGVRSRAAAAKWARNKGLHT